MMYVYEERGRWIYVRLLRLRGRVGKECEYVEAE